MARTRKQEPVKSLLELTGWVCQGGTIQAGLAREKVLFEYLADKYSRDPEVEVSGKVKVYSTDISFKKGGHEVDIIITNHRNKTILMVNSKSDGESGTDSPADRVKVPVAAKKAVQQSHPTYSVQYVYARPSGKANPVFEQAGIPTVATSSLLDGKDINSMIIEHRKAITAGRVEEAISRFCRNPRHAEALRKHFSNPDLFDY